MSYIDKLEEEVSILFGKFFLFSLAFFSVSTSLYGSCSPMRLDREGGPLERMPVLDQGNLNICYGYAVSQVIDAYRFSHGDKDFDHLTSPVAVSVYYSAEKEKDSIEYGKTEDAILSVLESGSCKHSTIYREVGQVDFKEYFEELEDYFDDFKNLGSRGSFFGFFKPKTPNELGSDLQCFIYEQGAAREVVPGLEEVLNALKSSTKLEYLKELFNALCKKNKKELRFKPKQHTKYARDFSPKDRTEGVFNSIHDAWETSNPQPVAISFCEDFLYRKGHVGVDKQGKVSSRCRTHHASIVVGRRPSKDGKTCQFLVRNSKGDSCNSYDWECENGQVWVDQEALGRNIYYTTWLE
ncbi:MAG: hypothetical protein CME64_06250 [Halobacteriovoraceae bacterium]|nr:hypothetical protein [Halobacteriovoraceae bacterium]|tara:strand:+ start:99864 stop:100922 length:1059 start_codon:yes stop_codon:yes gene_type:complete